MMTNKQIASIYNGYLGKMTENEAYERFMEKYPDYEGELNLLILGELPLDVEPELRAGHVDITELMAEPEAEEDDELDTSFPDDEDFVDPEDDATPVRVSAPVEKAAAPAPAKKDVTPRAESKQAKAIALYTAAADKSRKNIVALFKAQLGMTDAGAATYLQNVRKITGIKG